MIRLLLQSVLALVVLGGVAPAQAKKGSSAIAKVGLEDTFTAKDPKAMARLGVVDYGPLVWADIRIRPDRYEYVAALWPRAAKLLEDD